MLAAWLASRQAPDPCLTPAQRGVVQLGAVLGAIVGAHLFQWPSSAFGWTDKGIHLWQPLAGRTVLGGLIGGWLTVEFVKSRSGIRVPTGDGFAAPLALALAWGRLGCWWAGCCAGTPSTAWCARPDAAGVARVPVQLIEAGFHGLACGLLLIAARYRWQPGRRLAWYLLAYAALRLLLELWRGHPPLLLGMTWYQYLALTLAGLCVVCLLRQPPGPDQPTPGGAAPQTQATTPATPG